MAVGASVAVPLLALALGGMPDSPARLARLAPTDLQVTGSTLRVPSWSLGYAWARSGTTLALVVKPVATGQPVRIIDTRTLHTRRVVQVGDRDVCGLTFRGQTLVALAANQPCYWAGGTFSVLRIDPVRGRVVSELPVPGLHTAFPTNLAFGDGKAFVSRAGGGLDVVDLSTGAVLTRRPKRTLAKGEGIVTTRWLGQHLLGAGPLAIDVRTWRARRLGVGTQGLAPAGNDIAAYGPHGVSIYTRGARVRSTLEEGVAVNDVRVVGRMLYASAGASTDVVELRTGGIRTVATARWMLLAN
ncbi:MAG: hypothetical protein ACJ76I_08515 [Gaiellaceae bacterium]